MHYDTVFLNYHVRHRDEKNQRSLLRCHSHHVLSSVFMHLSPVTCRSIHVRHYCFLATELGHLSPPCSYNVLVESAEARINLTCCICL